MNERKEQLSVLQIELDAIAAEAQRSSSEGKALREEIDHLNSLQEESYAELDTAKKSLEERETTLSYQEQKVAQAKKIAELARVQSEMNRLREDLAKQSEKSEELTKQTEGLKEKETTLTGMQEKLLLEREQLRQKAEATAKMGKSELNSPPIPKKPMMIIIGAVGVYRSSRIEYV